MSEKIFVMTNKDAGGGRQFLDFIFRLYDFTDKYQRSIFWGFQFQESVVFFWGGGGGGGGGGEVLVTAGVFLGCQKKLYF